MYAGGKRGTVGAGRMAWEAAAENGGVGGLVRWASAVCCWSGWRTSDAAESV